MAYEGNAILEGLLGGAGIVQQGNAARLNADMQRQQNDRLNAQEKDRSQLHDQGQIGIRSDEAFDYGQIHNFIMPKNPTELDASFTAGIEAGDPTADAFALKIINANPDRVAPGFTATKINRHPDGTMTIIGQNEDGSQGVLTQDGSDESGPIVFQSAEDFANVTNIGYSSVLTRSKFDATEWTGQLAVADQNVKDQIRKNEQLRRRQSQLVDALSQNPEMQRAVIAALAASETNEEADEVLTQIETDVGIPTGPQAEAAAELAKAQAGQAEAPGIYERMASAQGGGVTSKRAHELKEAQGNVDALSTPQGRLDAAQARVDELTKKANPGKFKSFALAATGTNSVVATELKKAEAELAAAQEEVKNAPDAPDAPVDLSIPYKEPETEPQYTKDGDLIQPEGPRNEVQRYLYLKQKLTHEGGTPEERASAEAEVAELGKRVDARKARLDQERAETKVAEITNRMKNAKGPARERMAKQLQKAQAEADKFKPSIAEAAADPQTAALVKEAGASVEGKTAKQVDEMVDKGLFDPVNNPAMVAAVRSAMQAYGIKQLSDVSRIPSRDALLVRAFVAATAKDADARKAARTQLSNISTTGDESYSSKEMDAYNLQTAQHNLNTAKFGLDQIRLQLQQRTQAFNEYTSRSTSTTASLAQAGKGGDAAADLLEKTIPIFYDEDGNFTGDEDAARKFSRTIAPPYLAKMRSVSGVQAAAMLNGLNATMSMAVQSYAASDEGGIYSKVMDLFFNKDVDGNATDFDLDSIIVDDPKNPTKIYHVGPDGTTRDQEYDIKAIREQDKTLANFMVRAGVINTTKKVNK